MNDLTLVIMAAGMGSRFGGLKQIEPIGPSKEFILDYSIYDAILAGFNKVVFIIKEENYNLFYDTVGKRIGDKIETSYVFQKMEDVPENVNVPTSRVKPWGTAHAIYSVHDEVKGKFAIINADDFYGRDAFMKLAEHLKTADNDEFSLVGYKAINTLSENGSCKRGVCEVENGYLKAIIESVVEKDINGVINASPLDSSSSFIVKNDQAISMNMFGLNDSLLSFLETDIIRFFKENENNIDGCEYLIPDVIFDMVKNQNKKVKVIDTSSIWKGMTYKEDKQDLVDSINSYVSDGLYPENLWQ